MAWIYLLFAGIFDVVWAMLSRLHTRVFSQ